MDFLEIRDLLVAWLVLGLAFANLLGGLALSPVIVSLATVGIGFLLHELAHRAVARNFGLGARFEANYSFLGLAFLMSFFGFIFAAPGAVYTSGSRTEGQQVAISVAGPVTNVLLAAVFFFVPGQLGAYGFSINSWLALFNMIPFAGLDGESVYRYNQPLYFLVVGVSIVLVFFL